MTYREQVSRTVTRLTGRRAATPMQPIDAWPINSIFIAYSATNPNLLLGGGTWVQFAQGRMLISQISTDTDFDSLLDFGGEKTHVLTSSELPTHQHGLNSGTIPTREGDNITPKPNSGAAAYTNSNAKLATAGGASGSVFDRPWLSGLSGDGPGVNAAHNNMPPYQVVYMWRRTA